MVIKTTVALEDDLWKKFSIKVIEDYGGRKKTDIIAALVNEFVNNPSPKIDEAIEKWLKKDEEIEKSSKRTSRTS